MKIQVDIHAIVTKSIMVEIDDTERDPEAQAACKVIPRAADELSELGYSVEIKAERFRTKNGVAYGLCQAGGGEHKVHSATIREAAPMPKGE